MKMLYGEINIICIVMLLIILINSRMKKNNTRDLNSFRFLIIDVILLSVFDTIIWLCDSKSGMNFTILMKISSFIYFTLTAMASLNCLDYAMKRNNYSFKKFVKPLILIPFFVLIGLSFSSMFTNLIFNITNSNVYERGIIFYIQPAICFIYIFSGIIVSIYKITKSTYSHDRIDSLFIILFYLIPIIGGAIQGINFKYNVVWPFTSLALLVLYLNLNTRDVNIDSLTEVYNKETFEHVSNIVMSHTKGCLILIDIDNFKDINDLYGHKQGDQYLKMLSLMLKKYYNKNSIIGRIGGDEFGVYIKKYTDKDNIYLKTNSFLKSVNNFLNRVATIKFSCSVGISFDEKSNYPSQFREADEALALSKETGKNRYTVYSSEKPIENYKKKTMLIVDDDELNRVVLSSHFEKDFNILESINGKEALNVIEKYESKIDIILLDLIMPVLSGYDVLKEIKKNKYDCKVIVISIEKPEDNEIEGLGVDGYILKPFDPLEAKKVINRIREGL